MADRTVLPASVRVRVSVIDADGNEHIPTGKAERTLLLLLALHGDSLNIEHALVALWPDADPRTARRRLNALLQRLPGPIAPLIAREGDTLVLRADTDLADYAWALCILTAYRNLQLAPDARYADWAESVRYSVAARCGNLSAV